MRFADRRPILQPGPDSTADRDLGVAPGQRRAGSREARPVRPLKRLAPAVVVPDVVEGPPGVSRRALLGSLVAAGAVAAAGSGEEPPGSAPADGVEAPGHELATWPTFDRHGRRVGTLAVMARAAWEAMPVAERPAGHWSEDGRHFLAQRPDGAALGTGGGPPC